MPIQLSSLNQKKEKIYNHLQSCVQQETAEKVIERYYCLFVKATGYEEPEIRDTLEAIAKGDKAETEFASFLSNCCYIAINHWLRQSADPENIIPEFVKIFEDIPAFARLQTSASRRIRERVSDFNKSQHFLRMQRLRRLLTTTEETQKDKSQPLAILLGRYPFLYQNCILTADNYPQTKQALKKFQKQQEYDFEVSLSRYITNQVRLARLAERYGSLAKAQNAILPKPNPTLLKDAELIATLQHFISGVEGKSTYRDLAQRFLTHSRKADTFRTYKRDLYEYLIASIDDSYSKQQFNQRLAYFIKNTLTEWDWEKPNEQLILRIANNLLKFLVIESQQKIDHYLYLDLVTNLGPTKTIGLLLKIVLISNKIYPYLTSRFAILYNHYENTPRHNVHWLFKSLENLNIALTIHYSSLDLSYWSSANSLPN
ncbi:MAG: hypothetical protein BRC33_05650 [Cyanobacteria bacterium SW_9_44_58]|nr:MAG: hypothetical protein BRC33_05650 [Cyanobacteria bacterium SW_9_44_58]